VLKVERRGNVEIWTIEQPKTKNAIDYKTLQALTSRVHTLGKDRALRAVVLTGSGDTFVSGGDLHELRETDEEEEVRIFTDLGYQLTRRMEEMRAPIICAMPGAAIGGGAELAMACDMRIIDPAGIMSFRQVRMGVTTAWGTTERLINVCGASTAARMLFLAEDIRADEAKALRLVDAVSPPGEALRMALSWTALIEQGGPEAVAQMKQLLTHTKRTPAEARELEREKFMGTWMSAEHNEAMSSFFEKRAPVWPKP
jgi:enoyl-CoA hydratase